MFSPLLCAQSAGFVGSSNRTWESFRKEVTGKFSCSLPTLVARRCLVSSQAGELKKVMIRFVYFQADRFHLNTVYLDEKVEMDPMGLLPDEKERRKSIQMKR